MSLRLPALLVAAALVAVALVVPAAVAGSGDPQAVRNVAVRYAVATMNGSPLACQLMTPKAQNEFISAASVLTKTKLAGCPAAVKALAKLNESQFPSHQAYLRSNNAMVKAFAHSKVTVRGARATLDYTMVSGFVQTSSSFEFVRVQGHWLIAG